jgi:hypothetical protein
MTLQMMSQLLQNLSVGTSTVDQVSASPGTEMHSEHMLNIETQRDYQMVSCCRRKELETLN